MSYYQFERQDGETYGSFETFLWDRFDCQDAGLIERDSDSETGWVAFDFGIGGAYRFDVDPMGPFASEDDAISNANSLS